MLNMFTIVGRINNDPKINEENKMILEVRVPRSYKNEEGLYENDLLKITLYGIISENTKEYCHKNDLVGIKGRIQQKDNNIELIAEKLSFLSNKE